MKLPKGWKTLSLSAFLEQPESGASVLCEDGEPRSDEPGVLKLSCVTGGQFNPNDRKKPMANEVQRLTTFAKRNTILISRSNTPALVGASAYVKNDAPFAFLPDTLWMLYPKKHSIADVSMKWLSCLLLSDPHRLALQRIASGTSDSMKKIQKGALLKLRVAAPPLPEQRKIADIISTWDESLEKLDALIAAKERRKKGLMQRLLTGKRRVKGFDRSNGKTRSDRYGVYPSDWKHVSLGKITTEVVTRNADGTALPVLSCTKHQGLVLSEEYFGRRVYSADTSDYRVVKRGEYAYATNHIEEGSIGYQNVCDAGLVSPIYTVFQGTDEVDDRYLYRVLKSALLIHLYRANTSSSVDRRGGLRYGEFAKIHVWLPGKIEQRAIADIFDTCDEELSLLRKQRTSIEMQKRGVMQRLLTGAVCVRTEKYG